MTDAPIMLVTPLTAAEEYRQGAIKLLKEVLADAEAGKLEGVCIISEFANGDYSFGSSGTMEVLRRVGRLEALKWRLLQQKLEE